MRQLQNEAVSCPGYWEQSNNPNEEPEYIPVPDTELGDKVNNSPQAPQILPDVYNPNNPAGGTAPKTTSDAIDKAAPEPETQPNGDTKPKPNKDTDGDGIPDTYDPALPSAGEEFTLPAFCEWATTMCAWYEKYQEDSKKTDQHRENEEVPFYQKVKDWLDWTKEPPENNDNDNDVETEQPEPFDNSIFRTDRFSVSRQCPIPEQHTISLSGVSVNFSFDLTPLCKVLEFARPALVACSYLYAGE
ncbi:virulence factor TspB C-terminal domain-related protein [Acinetobacter sp. WZC-1]|uniref:virulence factor TspB C-terminal domain-related protein n=1 Tax=Acinetobacter sp. WZC-1 TaxID=3459034 RepID=UPI00403D663A